MTKTLTPLANGTKVQYDNSGVAEGTIIAFSGEYYTILDLNNTAEVVLWNAGYAVGACILPSQIVTTL